MKSNPTLLFDSNLGIGTDNTPLDRNQLSCRKNEYLKNLAKANIQLLMNQAWTFKDERQCENESLSRKISAAKWNKVKKSGVIRKRKKRVRKCPLKTISFKTKLESSEEAPIEKYLTSENNLERKISLFKNGRKRKMLQVDEETEYVKRLKVDFSEVKKSKSSLSLVHNTSINNNNKRRVLKGRRKSI